MEGLRKPLTTIELETVHEALCFAVERHADFREFMLNRGTPTTILVAWTDGLRGNPDDATLGHSLIGKIAYRMYESKKEAK